MMAVMRRCLALAACIAGTIATPAGATHNADVHSANVNEVASVRLGEGLSDVAFWGDLAVVGQFVFEDGSTDGFSVVDISQPERPRPITRFVCAGAGWDVSIWEHLVFLSVDDFTPSADESCAAESGPGFQGIKIVSIEDPAHPRQVGSVPMECSGSHTNTVVPDLGKDRLVLYTASLKYPYNPPQAGCDHIIEVPLGNPGAAKTVGALPADSAEACHDVAVHVARRLLAGACQTELRLYDIADLVQPRLVSVTPNPPSNVFQHSAAFSNDGMSLVTGEENVFYEGRTAACPGGTGSTSGAVWFYDISNAAAPLMRGYHQLQRGFEPSSPNGAGCSAHNFNVVPIREDRDLLVAAWYSGGMNVIDFTDLTRPAEVAYYQPALGDPARRAHYWAAYFYRGHVWTTNTYNSQRRSLDVYRVDDPQITTAFRLPHLNPQTQEELSEAPPTPPASGASPPGSGAPPSASGAPRARPPAAGRVRCRRKIVRVKLPGRARGVRASLARGGRRTKLRVRRRAVTVNPRRLKAGTHILRVRYRDARGNPRRITRRVRGCR